MRRYLITIFVIFCAYQLYCIRADIERVCGKDAACHVQLESPQ